MSSSNHLPGALFEHGEEHLQWLPHWFSPLTHAQRFVLHPVLQLQQPSPLRLLFASGAFMMVPSSELSARVHSISYYNDF